MGCSKTKHKAMLQHGWATTATTDGMTGRQLLGEHVGHLPLGPGCCSSYCMEHLPKQTVSGHAHRVKRRQAPLQQTLHGLHAGQGA